MPRDSYDRDREVILKTMRDQQPKIIAGVKVESVRDDDGFKFNLADGSWVLLRVSGTEPLVRIYSEAGSPEAVKARLDTIQDIVGLGGGRAEAPPSTANRGDVPPQKGGHGGG
jgi:phosphomannomutase